MKAYHLKTNEPDPYDSIGFETFNLNSIYVPERSVLVGFIKHSGMRGEIKPYNIHYCSRAQDIVEGNRNGVLGEVASKLELTADQVDIIASHQGSDVKTTIEYDSSTQALVGILTGELIRKGLIKRVLEKIIF